MANDDLMETCADAAVWSNVIANDVYDESTELKLTAIVTDGKYGSCVISGKKWSVWFEKTLVSCIHLSFFYDLQPYQHTLPTSMKK